MHPSFAKIVFPLKSVPIKMINYMVTQVRREHCSLYTLALVLRWAGAAGVGGLPFLDCHAFPCFFHHQLAKPLPSLCPSWDCDLQSTQRIKE